MLFRFFKRIDSNGKIFMPRMVQKMLGKEFYMEVYKDRIVLIPIKAEETEE